MILNHSKTIRSVISLLCSRYCNGNAQYGYNTSYCFTVIEYHGLLQLVSVLFIDVLWSLLQLKILNFFVYLHRIDLLVICFDSLY